MLALLLACAPVSAQLAREARVASEPGVTLAATLRLPQDHGAGPYPVVLLLSGNGPSRRGVYALLAERLLAKGIATFEYDKRGVGGSTGAFVDTIDLMQRDGAAAVAWLRGQPAIDPHRIAVLGMSQGGVVAPAMAAADPGIAALVTLAGPVGARSEPFMRGLRARLAEGGNTTQDIERITQAVRQWMEARSRGKEEQAVAPLRGAALDAFTASGATPGQAAGMVAVLDSPVLLSMYQAAPGADLARVRAPVLALFARADEVLAPGSVADARRALARNRDAEVVELAGVNHVFQRLDVAGAVGVDKPAVSAPEVLDRVVDWLEARLEPAGKQP